MAAERVRRWGVPPDTSIVTQTYGEVLCVSRQAMVEAIMDGEAFLARSGGILEVIVSRHPTDLAGEAVTTGAIVSWKPGPRATLEERPTATAPEEERVQVAREQARMAAPAPSPQITGTGPDGAVVVPQEAATATAVADRIGDGLDELEEEIDLSEIPEDHR